MIRVVVADDEHRVCQLICQLIHWDELGMELVGTASNGVEALQMIESMHPDLVLTDIRMSGYDGMELLKRARQIDTEIEFIIISGYSHFEYAQTAIRYGVSDYILKPIREETLNETLGKVRQRYLEHQSRAEETMERRKQQVMDQARLRDTLWTDLELEHVLGSLEQLNETYRYHFQEGMFQIFRIEADMTYNQDISEQYAENVMQLLHSKIAGLFQKYVTPFCVDSEVFCRSGKAAGIVNFQPERAGQVRDALETLINSLSMELHAFEYMRFHLAVGRPVPAVEQLRRCAREAELAMGERIRSHSSLFLEKVPENVSFDENALYKPFSVAIRNSLELQDMEQIEHAVDQLHRGVLMYGLNGVQMLYVARDAYRLFLMSGAFEGVYHFEHRDQWEQSFFRKSALCGSHDNLYAYLAQTCKNNLKDACQWLQTERMRPITRAKQYIQEHYAESISLEAISTEVGFSSSYFSTLFRKETGKNFLEYLTDVRIEQAKLLLRDTKETIETVARSVGINDYKRFSKLFKKSTGISPKEYRNLYS